MNIHYTLKTAIDTGDYRSLKEMLNECQSEQIVLKEDSSLIQMAKYFIKLNKKIDLSLFSKKEEMDFNKAFWYSDIKKIQKMMKLSQKYYLRCSLSRLFFSSSLRYSASISPSFVLIRSAWRLTSSSLISARLSKV